MTFATKIRKPIHGMPLPGWPDIPPIQLHLKYKKIEELGTKFILHAEAVRNNASLSEIGKREQVGAFAVAFLKALREMTVFVDGARVELRKRAEALDAPHVPDVRAEARHAEIRLAWATQTSQTQRGMSFEQLITEGEDREAIAALAFAPRALGLASPSTVKRARRHLWESTAGKGQLEEYDATVAGLDVFVEALSAAEEFAAEVAGADDKQFRQIIAERDRAEVREAAVAAVMRERDNPSDDSPGLAALARYLEQKDTAAA